ncbi:MAG: glycosyltransferase family 2 protein [Ktedonobacterales bacterium]|nr:glycosyltransferase family 2 protein [Ktedonobacterales bacterium]
MDLSIVLVNWNGAALVEQCLATIEASGTRSAYEVIVVDNASTDGSQERLRALAAAHPRLRCVMNAENAGFGAGNNVALPYCTGRYVLFLNTDTLVREPLDALVAAADALGERCGAVGGRVLNADETLQFTCRGHYTVPTMIAGLTLAFAGIRSRAVRRQEFAAWDHATSRDVAMLSGCYLLVPRRVLDAVGGFDPRIFLFYEDTDLCYRIRQAGYVVRYVPVATIVHLEGGSSRARGLSARTLKQSLTSARYFTRKHLGRGRARLLSLSVKLCWLAMLGVFAPLALVLPLRGPRARLRHRANLLWQGLQG